MSLDHLKNALPDYAKDIRLNLGSLATEPSLSAEQRAGRFIAIASRNPTATEAIIAEFAADLSPEALPAANAASPFPTPFRPIIT
jgi:alkyl hydroperoxide reductase subunit D